MSVLNLKRVKSLHTILDQVVWNVEEVKAILQRNPLAVNKVNRNKETPLLRVLGSQKFSTDLVEVLLDYSAEVNGRNFKRDTPLMVALYSIRGDATIKALLDKGADARVQNDVTGSTTLCYALQNGASKDVIKLLLEAGCHPNECRKHVSALHCATDEPYDALGEGILEMLVNFGANLLGFGPNGQSPVCLALHAGAGVKDIEFLLRLGSPLNACTWHQSIWWCALKSTSLHAFYVSMNITGWTAVLNSDMTELFNKEGAGSPTDIRRDDSDSPLGFVLSYCKYETEAIEILLAHPGVDINVRNDMDENLLHIAEQNNDCEPRVIELLIERGAKVDEVDVNKQTPLHTAIIRSLFWKLSVRQSIISILLKNNSPVNAVDSKGRTPLRVAVESGSYPDTFQLLLSAGAQVGVSFGQYSLLRLTLKRYLESECQLTLDSLKLLVKYYFLENPEFHIERLTRRNTPEIAATELKHLADECAREVQIIKSTNIDDHRTLLDLMRERSLSKMLAADKNPAVSSDSLNNILRIMTANTFSHFLADISATVGKSAMEIKLQELQVYSIKKRPVSCHMEERVILIYDCVLEIAQVLTQEDTMRLILAFYIPPTQSDSKELVRNNMKRKCEESESYGECKMIQCG